MNKYDVKLLLILLFVIVILLLIFNIFETNDSKEALVYYENDLLLTIDLSIDEEYIVDGYNGDVVIEVKDNKIRVKEETSPLHICSKQGFVDSVYEPLICLPNKIIIKLNNKETIDAIVK